MKFLKPIVGLLALQKAAGVNSDVTNSSGSSEIQSPPNSLNFGAQGEAFNQFVQIDGEAAFHGELGSDYYFKEAEKIRPLAFNHNQEDREIHSKTFLYLINKAIELNPEAKGQYHLRGQAYFNLDENDKALKDFQKEIEINPNVASYHEMGLVYLRKGESEKAAEFFSKVIKLENIHGAYYNRGIAYERMGYPRKALEDFNKELEINPSNQDAIVRKEEINPLLPHFEHEKLFIAAKEYFEQYLKEKEDSVDGADSLKLSLKNVNQAMSSFHEHLEGKETYDHNISWIDNIKKFATPLEKEVVEEYLTLREVLHDTISTKENGDADFAALVTIRPNVLKERHARARKHISEGKYQEALQDLDRIISSAPNKTWANYDRAVVLDKKDDHAGAIKFFTKEIDLNTDSLSNAYKARAYSYFKSENMEEAVLDLNRAISISDSSEDRKEMLEVQTKAKLNFVGSLKTSGDLEKLDNFLSDDIIGSNSDLRIQKAGVCSSLGRHEEAINHYKLAIANGADNRDKLYLKMAELHQNLGNKEEAFLDLNRAINTNAYSEEKTRLPEKQSEWLIKFLEEKGDIEKLDNFLSGDVIGSNPVLRVEKAEVCSSLGRHQEAINHYRLAIANGADNGDKLYLKMAELHQHLGRKEEALHDVNRSLKIKPSDEAYLERSYINWQLGNYVGATNDYDRGIGGLLGLYMASAGIAISAAMIGVAKLVADANRRNNPPPVIRENTPPIDVNETYPRETYGPSIKGYARDLLQYCASYEDMLVEENGELQKSAIFNLGKENFSGIIKKVLNVRYDAKYHYETKDGKDFSTFDFSIGHLDNDPYFKESFVSEIEFPENYDHAQKMKFLKNSTREKIADFLDSFAEDLLHEVKNNEEKEFLKSILLTCLQDSHSCDLTLKYNIRGVERDKNMLYDRIAKSGDYTIVDPDKLADGKAIFREAALEYFMDIYEKIAKEKAPNQVVNEAGPEAPKANFKPEEKSSLIGSSQIELS